MPKTVLHPSVEYLGLHDLNFASANSMVGMVKPKKNSVTWPHPLCHPLVSSSCTKNRTSKAMDPFTPMTLSSQNQRTISFSLSSHLFFCPSLLAVSSPGSINILVSLHGFKTILGNTPKLSPLLFCHLKRCQPPGHGGLSLAGVQIFKSRSWLSHKKAMLASIGLPRLSCPKLQMKKGLEGKMKKIKELHLHRSQSSLYLKSYLYNK